MYDHQYVEMELDAERRGEGDRSSDTIEQRIIPGGSNDEKLTT